MTKIVIFKKENKICGFQIKGHTGFAESGKDIVCSAISVASQMALVGLEEVLALPLEKHIQDGFMSVMLEKTDDEKAQVILESMEKTLWDIAKNHSKYVYMEVREDVY